MQINYDVEAWELYLRAVKELVDNQLAVRVDGQDLMLSKVEKDKNGYVAAVVGRLFQKSTGVYDGPEVTIRLIDDDDLVLAKQWTVL